MIKIPKGLLVFKQHDKIINKMIYSEILNIYVDYAFHYCPNIPINFNPQLNVYQGNKTDIKDFKLLIDRGHVEFINELFRPSACLVDYDYTFSLTYYYDIFKHTDDLELAISTKNMLDSGTCEIRNFPECYIYKLDISEFANVIQGEATIRYNKMETI